MYTAAPICTQSMLLHFFPSYVKIVDSVNIVDSNRLSSISQSQKHNAPPFHQRIKCSFSCAHLESILLIFYRSIRFSSYIFFFSSSSSSLKVTLSIHNANGKRLHLRSIEEEKKKKIFIRQQHRFVDYLPIHCTSCTYSYIDFVLLILQLLSFTLASFNF